jgi:hypothetical protein
MTDETPWEEVVDAVAAATVTAVSAEQFARDLAAAIFEGDAPWACEGFRDSNGYELITVEPEEGAGSTYTVQRLWQNHCGVRQDIRYGLPRLVEEIKGVTAPGVVYLLGGPQKTVEGFIGGIVEEFAALYRVPEVKTRVHDAFEGAPLPQFK